MNNQLEELRRKYLELSNEVVILRRKLHIAKAALITEKEYQITNYEEVAYWIEDALKEINKG
jgi:hypothetical protein